MRRLLWALLPAVVFTCGDVIVSLLIGRVDLLSAAASHVLLPAGALARYAGMFVLAGPIWWLLRRSAASRPWRVLGVLAGPTAYAISAAWHLGHWFPTGQALYYALNPLTLAAIGSSTAMAALGEMIWRRRPTAGLIVLSLAGWAVLYATVLWDGGVHWFYVYQQGFAALFG